MPNPYLPDWEYIPDGEPKVFGDRVYIYGSHDLPASDEFCDTKLKVWSAPVSAPGNWVCHGHIFHTQPDRDHPSDTAAWTQNRLFAPDVVEKDGKYYLYAYIVGAHGCVAVSDKPEGPFRLLGQYITPDTDEEDLQQAIFIDPGVLVDDDGRVYIYCGYLHSWCAELNPDNMREVLPGTYRKNMLPAEAPFHFFEACSPIRIGDTYYLIYSPNNPGARLVYATSDKPLGPYTYRGVIIDNGVDYPGGNDHGCICRIGEQWYIFYHRMTNGTCMSRRGCVERIEILPDGTIPQVEMTSLGFDESLNPYRETKAEWACVLKGGAQVVERNVLERPVVDVKPGCVMGWKYFDFGEDLTGTSLRLFVNTHGKGQKGVIHVHLDAEDGEEIGTVAITPAGGLLSGQMKGVTGRHAVFFTFETGRPEGWMKPAFENRELCEVLSFVFCK